MNTQFLTDYFKDYANLAFDPKVWPLIAEFADTVKSVREQDGKLLFFGNGASAALAEHAALDFTKQGKVRARTCHDAAPINGWLKRSNTLPIPAMLSF